MTPGQLTQRSEFYFQLYKLTDAGVTLVNSLRQIQRHPPSATYRGPIERVLGLLEEGSTFGEALTHTGQWLPSFDITLIEAGEKSGRLEQSFRHLADYYGDRARTIKQMLADLAYPIFLLHFFVFIIYFQQLFLTRDWGDYLTRVLTILIPVYVLTGVVLFAMQSGHREFWRAWIEFLLHRIPVLGTARHYLALARLASALEALLSAGVTIIEAWELAAGASGSPALRRIVASWKPSLLEGRTPAEAVSNSSRFPGLFANEYASGEVSGKLDETLQRLHTYYQDEGMRKLRSASKWVPIFIYLVIMFVIGRFIIEFYLGHFSGILDGEAL